MISASELTKLEKLSAIELTAEEKEKFNNQIGDIVDFLGGLNNIDVSDIDLNNLEVGEHTLRVKSGVKESMKTEDLLSNVKHEKINNSVVIKSVLG